MNRARRNFARRIWFLPNGCWLLAGYIQKNGYANYNQKGVPTRMAHRASYILFVGPIPEGLTLDHLCYNTWCVNPNHLEPVTMRENARRTRVSAAGRWRQTHCIHGHEFTPENTYRKRGGLGRLCKQCVRTRDAKRGPRRKKEAQVGSQ